MLNWLLLINGIAVLFIGTYIWFSTLHERNNYHTVFGMQSSATKIAVQDTVRSATISGWCWSTDTLYTSQFKCCGYLNATDEVAFGGTSCPNAAAAMAANSFCVTPITKFADTRLNNVFR